MTDEERAEIRRLSVVVIEKECALEGWAVMNVYGRTAEELADIRTGYECASVELKLARSALAQLKSRIVHRAALAANETGL